jgi:hypothetical protein
MNLPCLLAAPTLIRSGGEIFLARPLALEDFAFLLRAAGDFLGRDADAGVEVEFFEPAVIDWMFDVESGLPLLLWRALRRDRPELSIDDAEALAESLDAVVIGAIYRAAMRRDLSSIPTEGEGRDIAVLSWGRIAYRYFEQGGVLPDALGRLTLDQMHAIASLDEDETTAKDREEWAAMQAEWERIHGQSAQADAVELTDQQRAVLAAIEGKGEVTLQDLGWELVDGETAGDV